MTKSDRVPTDLARTLSTFADRLFRTGGEDPGDAALPLPPDRLDVYRTLVQRNYRAMIRFAFTESLRLIAHVATEHGPEGGVGRVIARFLEVSPAETHSTREMADRFGEFLPREFPTLFEIRPDLAELMALERAELRATYHVDDPGRGVPADEVERLATLSVGEFLALRIVRAPSATFLRFEYPVVTLHHELRHRRYPAPETAPQRVTVSRHPVDLTPVFLTFDEEPARLYEIAAPGETATLESLAERWIEALPEESRSTDEEALLAVFAQAVFRGLGAGFFRLA